MKKTFTNFSRQFLVAILLQLTMAMGAIHSLHAAVITSQANGNWNQTAVWDLGRLPADGDDVVIADGTTVTANTTVNFATYGTLTVGQGSSGILNIGGVAITMQGDLVVNGGATVNCTSGAGAKTFNNITIYGTWTNNANTVFIFCNGNFTVEGTFTQNAGTLNLSGSNGAYGYQNNGTHTITTGPMNFTGSAGDYSFNTTNVFAPGTGTVTFSGANSNYAIGSNDPLFYNLQLNSATATLDAVTYIPTLSVTNNFSLNNGIFYSAGTFNVKNCIVANQTTAIFNASTFTYVTGTFNIGNATSFVPGTGLVSFKGNAAQTIGSVSGLTFYNLQILNTVAVNLTNSFNYTVQNNVYIEAGAVLTSGTNTILNVGYEWNNNGGTFNASTGTVNLNNQGFYSYITTDGNSPNQTFNNLTISVVNGYYAEATNLSSLTVNGNFTLTSGGFNPPTNMTVKGNVILTSGVFYNPTTNLNVGGNWTNNGATFDYWNCSCNAMVTFNGSAAQVINGTATTQTFQGVTINKPGAGAASTLTNSTVDSLVFNDNFTLSNGIFSSAVLNGSITVYSAGNPAGSFVFNGGTFSTGATTRVTVYGPGSQTGGTVASLGQFRYIDMYGATQTVITGSYANLTFDNNDKILSAGTIAISGVFTPGTALGHTTTGNTISFTGNTSQVIPNFNYNGIATGTGYGGITTTTTKVFGGDLAFNGVFNYAGATTSIALDTMNMLIGPNGSIAGVPSATHMILINGTGKLIKAFSAASAQTYTYPVGIGNSYTPVTLTFNKVTTAGQVALSIVPGVNANAIAPPATATNWLKKSWVLDKNTTSIAFDYYSAKVAFLSTDYNANLTAGAGGESTMGAMLWDGTAWQTNGVVTIRTALNPTASYLTQLGELTFATCLPLAKTADPQNQFVCTSGSNSVNFTVGVSGTPATYQWYMNGTPLSDGGIYSGTKSSKLTLTNATSAVSGNTYYCVVTATCTGNFTSNSASISTISAVPGHLESVTVSPAEYRPGDNVTFTAHDTSSSTLGTSYQFWQVFAENQASLFYIVQDDSRTSLTINNISQYGTSIKSPGVTWMYVLPHNACGVPPPLSSTFSPILVIPPTTFVNPCNGNNGSISFPGLRPNGSYTINYSKNNVVQPQLSLSADSTGVLTMPNLGPGKYSNMILLVLGVGSSINSAPADSVVLIQVPCSTVTAYNLTYNNGINTGGIAKNTCPGINIGLANADAGVTYKLYENGALVSTITRVAGGAFNFNYTTIGGKTYTVTGTQSAGPVNMNGSVITYDAPTAIVSNSGLTGCVVPGVSLGTLGSSAGSGSISSYQWSDTSGTIAGATDSIYVAKSSGIYSVVITNTNSCSTTSATSIVIANANPTADITGNISGCSNPGVVLSTNGSVAGSGLISSYQWSDGNGIILNATDSTFVATASGAYTVVITNSNSCSTTSIAKSITVNANPVAVISGNLTGCADPGVTLGTLGTSAGSGTISLYQWSGSNGTIAGATDSSYVATTSGTYSVVVTNSNSCTATSAISTVTANTVVPPTLTYTDSIICPGDSAQFCVPDNYASYEWNTHATGFCTYVKQAGGYWVTVTSNDGCKAISEHKTLVTYPTGSVSILVQGDTLSSFGAAGYQWYLDGKKIPGATSRIYIARQSGVYIVEITNENGCHAKSSAITMVVLGIEDVLSIPVFAIYPNPASTQILIEAGKEWVGKELELYNIQGQLLMKKIVQQEKTAFDISSAANGMYIIKMDGQVQKFLKQ